jgi:transcriptional regulator with XRE-family HTH domain
MGIKSLKSIEQWEINRDGGVVFPRKELLPKIAEIYRIDLEVLTQAFEFSKNTKDNLKGVRKTLNKIPKRGDPDFPSHSGRRTSIMGMK